MTAQPGCPCSICESDNLRDRIIRALEANFDDAAPSLSMLAMADAVIQELEQK